MSKQMPIPRSANYFGMRASPQFFELGTWLEPEEITYPSGAMIRRARAINTETGRLNMVYCGIPDTFFTIPVRGGGFLDMSGESQVLRYHPPIRKHK